ncbi:type I-B CRISPR-associated endonuclease Cas1b [Aquifex aeolicus]|uniref:CRISPR-associated endonuclease Cas1 n=2 Tax=Aquifex aeolicus TaxID=63363 RepID=CAS1_AQUAE|nr:type I-B CRISPR-associated endonuclease Cas1b [Aquifex aeolicus]O66692.1 RecName: Full=CRISPR-associated endonuclease Cas1 [Aquifex aeolicus VF5]AAC06657.1 hypothetical protein aq_369 [Aquifex aeolicus VF5]
MGRVYYINSHGTLSRHENTLRFENAEVKKDIPVEDVEEIFVFAELSLNTKLLNFLASKGIPLHFFNYYGYYTGTFYPRESSVSGHLLIKQVEHYLDAQKRLYLAKSFVIGSILNLEYVYKISADTYLNKVKETNSIPELMSVEAEFRKLCYKKLEEVTGWELEKRTKRPPQNPLNALISFGNSLTYAKVLGEIYKTQLNPTVSYLHEPSTKRFSLSLDVAEVFKPIFVDNLIIRLIQENKIDKTHFSTELNMTFLNEIGRKVFLKAFNELLETTIFYPKLNRKVSHRTLIKLELYKLIKHLLEEEVYLPLNYGGLK